MNEANFHSCELGPPPADAVGEDRTANLRVDEFDVRACRLDPPQDLAGQARPCRAASVASGRRHTLRLVVRSRFPPLIISGMHRSGTSVLTRVLERLGLFVGWRQQPRHHEARFFQHLNDWLLAESGGSWEYPDPMDDLLASDEFRDPAIDFLRYNLRTLRTFSFVGPHHWVTNRQLAAGMRVPWGWKDPRTTLALPLWVGVYPQAKILHIQRHGVDVAASLQVRNARLMGNLPDQLSKARWRYHIVAPRRPHTAGFRLYEIGRGFELWSAYERVARRHLAAVSAENVMVMRYEDLLMDPATNLAALAQFYPLRGNVASVYSEFDPSRAYAHRTRPELLHFAATHRDDLTEFGY
jgi:hypothetical protein